MGKDKTDYDKDAKALDAESTASIGGYEAMFAKADEAKETEPLNLEIIKWESPGQRVIGKFLKAEVLPESKFDTQVNRWIIETDSGLVSCIPGSMADKESLPKLAEGDLVCITYNGTKDIGGGKTVNLVDIRRFGKAPK